MDTLLVISGAKIQKTTQITKLFWQKSIQIYILQAKRKEYGG